MDIILEKSKIEGRVIIPPSKSQAHRVMIASFLSGVDYDFGLQGDDVNATKDCLDNLKKLFNGEVEVAHLNAKESGSTLRFLLPIICALDVNAEIVGEGRLPERPISELLGVLRQHGANIDGNRLPLKVVSPSAELCTAKGGLKAGEFKVNGGISSQYITGLLFALPLLDGDSHIVIEGDLVSKDYVEMTLDVLHRFGIIVEKDKKGFFIKGNQKYVANDLSIEGDWSSAAFPLALGLLTGKVCAENLDDNSKQADRVFLSLVKQMGGIVDKISNGLETCNSNLKAINFDATNCPDIVPIMAILASFAEGKSTIFGVDRLKAKESDRLLAVRELLEHLGVPSEYKDNTLLITGGIGNNNSEIVLDSFSDHRIAMSAIVAGLALGSIKVKGIECISKSYPTFLQDIKTLGAKFELD